MPAPRSSMTQVKSHGTSPGSMQNPVKEERVLEITQHAKPAIHILISDRDPMSSDLLANAVAIDHKREAAAISPTDLLQELTTRKVDVVVIAADQRFKSGDGFDLASTLARSHPATMIVIILNESSPESVIHAFRSGARGVFARHQPMSDLHSCIDHVLKGLIWAGREETDSLLEAFKSIPSPRILNDSPSLTARELQVVQCAATGKTNRAIASELGLSEHTIKNYMFRAFDKLGVTSRTELLFYLTMRGSAPNAATIGQSGPQGRDELCLAQADSQ